MGLIRLLLAICVLLFHCPSGLVARYIHPALAVQCFYAVSGFLIQLAIRANYEGSLGWQKRFYMSRVLRIFPLYLLFAFLTAALIGTGHFEFYVQKRAWGVTTIWVLNNALIAGQDVLRFFYFNLDAGHFMVLPQSEADRALVRSISGSMTEMGQSWTLALELYFYLLAPYLLTRRSRVLMALVPVLVALRLWLGHLGHFQSEWVYGFFPSELAVFLSGSLACRAYLVLFESRQLAKLCERAGFANGDRVVLAVSAGVVVALCWLYLTIDLNFAGGSWGTPPTGVARGYWLILLMTVLALPCAFHFSKNFKWDRFIGELSYPVYISHFLIIQLITQMFHPTGSSENLVGLSVLVISLVLSIALIILIEKPIDSWRHRLFYRAAVTT